MAIRETERREQTGKSHPPEREEARELPLAREATSSEAREYLLTDDAGEGPGLENYARHTYRIEGKPV